MSSIELSVIIPAYNAGQAIGRCLDSLLQSMQQVSWDILKTYSMKYACY